MTMPERPPVGESDPPLAGLVADGALPRVLREVYVGRRTGRLHLSRDDQRYSVRFVNGAIIHCESSVPQAHLGQVMVSLGMLAEPARAEAAEIVDRTGKRLGEVLLGMGAIDQGRLLDALAAQVREHLLKVFTWTSGGCAFEPRPAPRDTIALKLSTGQMILEAVRLTRRPEAIRSGLGDLGRVVILSTDPMFRFQRVTLTADDGFVLSRVDGLATAREILQLVPLPAEDAERSLYGLLCTGLVDFLPAEAGPELSAEERRAEIVALFESLPHRDHFEILQVPRDASQADVAASYHRIARRFHPDSHHEPALADLLDALEAIFERASVAYDVLRRPASRRAYVATLMRIAAEAPAGAATAAASTGEEARRAAEALDLAGARGREGRQWEAIGILEGLATFASGTVRQRARLQLADLYAGNPRSAKAAEQQLLAVIAEDPGNVDARMRLARSLRERQRPARAAECLRQVLDLHPAHPAAAQMLAEIEGAGQATE